MSLILTGVGSRSTPEPIQKDMIKIGQWVRECNHIIRSGHAEGADWAFEQGAQESCIAYLPWSTFNHHLKSNAKKVTVVWSADLEKMTAKYHPSHGNLGYSVRKLMNRNACQVLGIDLKSPADAVICWTKDGLDYGGTSQAIRIARGHSIPIINMGSKEFSTYDSVIESLMYIWNKSSSIGGEFT